MADEKEKKEEKKTVDRDKVLEKIDKGELTEKEAERKYGF